MLLVFVLFQRIITHTTTKEKDKTTHKTSLKTSVISIGRHFTSQDTKTSKTILQRKSTYYQNQYNEYQRYKRKPSAPTNSPQKKETKILKPKLHKVRLIRMAKVNPPSGATKRGPGRPPKPTPTKGPATNQPTLKFTTPKLLLTSSKITPDKTTEMKSPSKILFPQTTTPTKTATQHPVVSPDSVTQDFSLTQGDITETVLTSNVTKCPKLTSVVKETKSQFETTTTTYITRVQYRKKVPSSPNVIDMMKTLAACFMQYNTTVQILPYDDACKSNPIITPRDIPTEVDEFALYVPHATVSRRNVLFMKFRIKSDMSLFKLKKVRGIMNFLERWSIYLDQMYLKSSDTVKIGGFLKSSRIRFL